MLEDIYIYIYIYIYACVCLCVLFIGWVFEFSINGSRPTVISETEGKYDRSSFLTSTAATTTVNMINNTSVMLILRSIMVTDINTCAKRVMY